MAKKKIIIGLTGGFGSGKSTVARIFRSSGAKVVDANSVMLSVSQGATFPQLKGLLRLTLMK